MYKIIAIDLKKQIVKEQVVQMMLETYRKDTSTPLDQLVQATRDHKEWNGSEALEVLLEFKKRAQSLEKKLEGMGFEERKSDLRRASEAKASGEIETKKSQSVIRKFTNFLRAALNSRKVPTIQENNLSNSEEISDSEGGASRTSGEEVSDTEAEGVGKYFYKGHRVSSSLKGTGEYQGERWETPVGYLMPVSESRNPNAEIKLERVNVEFSSAAKHTSNRYTNNIVRFMFEIGVTVGSIQDPALIPEGKRDGYIAKVTKSLSDSYFVQLGIDAIPYGYDGDESYFSQGTVSESELETLQNIRSIGDLLDPSVEVPELSSPARHMVCMSIFIFLLYRFDNLIDDGVVLSSSTDELTTFTNGVSQVIEGKQNRLAVQDEVYGFLDSKLGISEDSDTTIEKEKKEIDAVLKLAVLMEKFGDYGRRFPNVSRGYTDKAIVDNYLECVKLVDEYGIDRKALFLDNLILDDSTFSALQDSEGHLPTAILERRDMLDSSKLSKFKEFIGEASDYFYSSVREMAYSTSKSKDSMTTESYKQLRRSSGAVLAVMRLSELETQSILNLPEYLSKHVAYKDLEDAIVDIIWGVNDLASSKELKSHEPNFLKVRMREHVELLSYNFPAASIDILIVLAFQLSMVDLLSMIGECNDKFLNQCSDIEKMIQSGTLFSRSRINLNAYSPEEKALIQELVQEDFGMRVFLMNNLVASGNLMISNSSRYYNPDKTELNVTVSDITPVDIGYKRRGNSL